MERDTTMKHWVQDHHVTWELGPWQELVAHRVTPVGYELRLFAVHARDAHPSPGCADCVTLYDRLRAIAESVLPREHRPTRYDVERFDTSLHHRPESNWTPEVQLTVHILHRDDYLQPVDECEKRCADEIQRGLKSLGARPRSWSNASGSGGVS